VRSILYLVVTIFTLTTTYSSVFATVDDILQFVPLTYAGFLSIKNMDKVGGREIAIAAFSNQVTIMLLKGITHEGRPSNPDATNGWPSGHTAIGFVSAGAIHKRYGFRYALPAYIVSAIVGDLRIKNGAHTFDQVLFGAAIGAAIGYFMTTEYRGKYGGTIGIGVVPLATHGMGLNIRYAM